MAVEFSRPDIAHTDVSFLAEITVASVDKIDFLFVRDLVCKLQLKSTSALDTVLLDSSIPNRFSNSASLTVLLVVHVVDAPGSEESLPL